MEAVIAQRRPASQIVRGLVLAVLAVMLLVRLGPLCETSAMAAAPVASQMTDCASKPTRAPAKQVPPAACATPCVAMPGVAAVGGEPLPFAALLPSPAKPAGLIGMARAPATPPPRSV